MIYLLQRRCLLQTVNPDKQVPRDVVGVRQDYPVSPSVLLDCLRRGSTECFQVLLAALWATHNVLICGTEEDGLLEEVRRFGDRCRKGSE
jgi:hypothetical protein